MVSEFPADDVNIADPPLTERAATADVKPPVIASSSFLGLTNRDQWLVVTVTVVAVILLGLKWQQLRYVDRSQIVLQRASEDIGYQIELNSATWVELTQLRGVGELTARRIVEDREEFGVFSTIDSLQRVPGIGPITIEKNRRWLRVDVGSTLRD